MAEGVASYGGSSGNSSSGGSDGGSSAILFLIVVIILLLPPPLRVLFIGIILPLFVARCSFRRPPLTHIQCTMVGCCLLLSTALFVIARRPATVDDCVAGHRLIALVSRAFVALWSLRGRRHRHRHTRGRRCGPVGGHEAMVEDHLVLQR